MDYKVFRTAVLAIVSTLILVLVIVYATNADKIKEIFGKGGASDTEASADTSSSSDFGMYGEQIGDNTQAFLFEEGFFDANEDIPSVVVTKKGENRSSAGNSTESSTEAFNRASNESSDGASSDATDEEFNDYIEPAAIVGSN
ncbi:hypothetical protein SAMN02910451_03046 [Butyrivibrio hungatei]|uniref:Uncharacterized protein n=1 Tax=Butyrivibrio hungatei TaxID=185008 RepID=A0A1G5GV48_9FIRM|nr:hypothetical protein [Butyrivibrio hungatei]SCY55050.1 hypothetical protein SAMN02910451_03046 [Butyrivibrio hungatei]